MSDIFKEVDEEVQRDKVELFFKKHSSLLISLLIAIIAGVGIYRVYSHYENQKATAAGQAYEAAMALFASGKATESVSALESLSKQAPAGYKMLSSFRLASELAKTDKAAAAKAFDALAADATLDQTLRDLARLRAGMLLADTVSFTDLQQRLDPLAASGQTWRLMARELLAGSAFKAKEYKKSEGYLELILGDKDTSQEQRERVQMMMALLRGTAQPK